MSHSPGSPRGACASALAGPHNAPLSFLLRASLVCPRPAPGNSRAEMRQSNQQTSSKTPVLKGSRHEGRARYKSGTSITVKGTPSQFHIRSLPKIPQGAGLLPLPPMHPTPLPTSWSVFMHPRHSGVGLPSRMPSGTPAGGWRCLGCISGTALEAKARILSFILNAVRSHFEI